MKTPVFFLILVTIASHLLCQTDIKVENLGNNVNSIYSDYVPIITPDGKTLYFFRMGDPTNTMYSETHDCGDIWYSNLDSTGKWTLAQRLKEPFNRGQYNSIESVSSDGNVLMVRGAYKKGKYVDQGFSLTYRTKNGWSEFEKLDIIDFNKMNKGLYWGGFMTGDGKVLFIYMCEVKDGMNSDLYICFKVGDHKWSKPEKLGDPINTEYNEISPFLASDRTTLYFSRQPCGRYRR